VDADRGFGHRDARTSLRRIRVTRTNILLRCSRLLLSIEDYRKLTARADTRKAGRLETMPGDLFESVKEAGDET
jgi:hypothetical protein